MKSNIKVMYKGDDVIAVGTVMEIAQKLGKKLETVKFYGTPSYKKRIERQNGKNRLILVSEDD